MEMENENMYVLCEFLNEDTMDGDDTDRPVQIGFSE